MNQIKDFSTMPSEYRMTARQIVDDNGGLVTGYEGGQLSVAVPRDWEARGRIYRGLLAMGLKTDGTCTLFPLITDNPPEGLRHFGFGTAAAPRGDRPSYLCYERYWIEQ